MLRLSILMLMAVWMLAGVASIGLARPNILFIMSDDHAYQSIGAYGSKMNKTPHLDRIANEGVRFDRCYVTDSICGPSRATILTGKYGHLHGVRDNYTEFDGSQPTFPKQLKQAGYQTAIIGKWHLKSDPTGFDHWDILPGQGKYYRPVFRTPEGRRDIPGYVTDVTTDLAIDWLTDKGGEGRASDKPFLLMVHHKAPHRPWDPATKYLDDYSEQLPKPETLADDYRGKASAIVDAEMRIEQMRLSPDLKVWEKDDRHRKWLYSHMSPEELAAWEQHRDSRLAKWNTKNPESDLARRRVMYQMYLQDYLGCINSIDESVGRLLDTLDSEGLSENTIVIYTSDQGFYLGEHGWFDKRLMYEESLRTPLLVRMPTSTEGGKVEQRIVSNVDFAATLLDAAQAGPMPGTQGTSFLPMLEGEQVENWRDAFYYNYHEGRERDHAVARHEGVTNGTQKLIHYYEEGEWELYDLASDPHEMRNVYGEPGYADVQMQLDEKLAELREELKMPDLPKLDSQPTKQVEPALN